MHSLHRYLCRAILIWISLFIVCFMLIHHKDVTFTLRDELSIDNHVPVLQKAPTRTLHTSLVNPTFLSPELLNAIFLIHTPDRCTDDVYLMTFVHSATRNFERRQLIRKTWASYDSKMKTIFILGTGEDGTQTSIREEALKYHDIAQFDFIDTYRNLTLKQLMGIRWVQEFCPHAKYLLKVDDDVIVNPEIITESLQGEPALTVGIHCCPFHHAHPIRNKADKWYITEDEYPGDKYPDYCEGYAYFVATEWLAKLYAATATERFLWIDDVYVTGLLAEKAGVPRIEMARSFRTWAVQSTRAGIVLRDDIQRTSFALLKYNHNAKLWMQAWCSITTKDVNCSNAA